MSESLAEFNRERDEALISLDEEKIRAMYRKYNHKEMPKDSFVFWGSVHKAITGAVNLPIELRRQSKMWLTMHGLQSFDDGDLQALSR